MNEYILTEFSIFYKRLIRIELCLKTLILTQYTNCYGPNAYKVAYRYLATIEKYRPTNDCTFSKIYKSNKVDSEKFIASVNKMYTGEILNLFCNPIFLKNKKIQHSFFSEKIETNSTFFQRKARFLKEFRNCVAHCDEKKLTLDRTKFIDSLVYFEKILRCNDSLSFDVLNKIDRSKKLSTKTILKIIYAQKPHYFNNDKLLILLFDDIALMTGYTFKSLPQRWSIIRQKYELSRKLADEFYTTDEEQIDEKLQQSFDFDK